MELKKKFTVIIQARIGSTRLKGKILKKIKSKTFLEILISRIKKSKKISNIIVATTKKKRIIKLLVFVKKKILAILEVRKKMFLKDIISLPKNLM